MGYMGSGKSVIAHELGKTTNLLVMEMDAYIEESENRTITSIFETVGEIYFRIQERKYLTEILNNDRQFILSLGGGTPCYGNNIEIIKTAPKTKTVYLSATPETLTDRLFPEKGHRPVIAHLETKEALNDFIRKHMFERSFYYNQADITIKTDNRSLKEIAEEISDKLF